MFPYLRTPLISPSTISSSMKKLTFYYDIVCPYAYLASHRIEDVAERCGATVDWQPVLLGGIYKSIEAPQVPSGTWSEPRARLGALDLLRQAANRSRAPSGWPWFHSEEWPRATTSEG